MSIGVILMSYFNRLFPCFELRFPAWFKCSTENFDGGAGLNLIALKSKMSGLPEAFIANLRVKLFEKYMHLAEENVVTWINSEQLSISQ